MWSPYHRPSKMVFRPSTYPLPHLLEESLPDARLGGRRGTPEKAYPIDFRGRLRVGGERYGEQAAGQSADECPPRGHSITSSAR